MLLVAVGLGLSIYALATWNQAGFGRARLPGHPADRHPGRDADRVRDADRCCWHSSSASWGYAAAEREGGRRNIDHERERRSRHGEASAWRVPDRASYWVVQVAPFVLAFAAYVVAFLVMRPDATGDEPHYLARRPERRFRRRPRPD